MIDFLEGFKQHLYDMSVPASDGVYRNGEQLRSQRTAYVTEVLQKLWDYAISDARRAFPQYHIERYCDDNNSIVDVALAAVGSLGRGEIGPCSDLDLVIMHRKSMPAECVKAIADRIWYPLWDTGIDLDYSVRTVEQCVDVCSHDLPAAVGWLQVRPIAGDESLVLQTAEKIHAQWRKVALKRLSQLKDSAQGRYEQFGAIATQNQPNIKEARGGLRDASLVVAIASSWLADRPHGDYDAAVRGLLDVRDCVHLVTHKDVNMITVAHQPQIAQMLGLSDPTLEEHERDEASIELLQTRLARLSGQIAFGFDSTYSHALHTITHEKPRFAFFMGKREAPKFTAISQHVAMHEQEIILAKSVNPLVLPMLPLEVAVASVQEHLPISPVTLQSLRRSLALAPVWNDETRKQLLTVLSSGSYLLQVWGALDSINLPSRWIPEWAAVHNRPSSSSAHRFTIDRHMIEVVSHITHTTERGDTYSDTEFTALLLASWLHDIGKRRGVADHSVEGAKHIPVVLGRMGFSQEIIDIATILVREHLSLSTLATKESPNNSEAVERLAKACNYNSRIVDMLFDLTRADSNALGATPQEMLNRSMGWSKWRASLVTVMYEAVRAVCSSTEFRES